MRGEYRRLSLREKTALSRRMAPVVWQCVACGVKVTTRDQQAHAARHGGRCGFRAVAKACARCGKEYRTRAGAKLNMHARCRFSPAEADALLQRTIDQPTLGRVALANELGVSVDVLRVTLAVARKRRAGGILTRESGAA